jgi:hypothetical protein
VTITGTTTKGIIAGTTKWQVRAARAIRRAALRRARANVRPP